MKISINEASKKLLQGEVVAVPTETVYGLAARFEHLDGIYKIFQLKKRPQDNPLIVHVGNKGQVGELVESCPPGYEDLIAAFWPGPLTLIFPIAKAIVPDVARAGLPSVAIRMPSHPQMLALLAASGPLVAPSANLSGRPSATCAAHVEEDFGHEFPVVDGGICRMGLESTILHWEENGGWRIARHGAVSAESLSQIISLSPVMIEKEKPLCPGQKHRHYSPKCTLIAGFEEYAGDEACVVGYSDRKYHGASQILALGASSRPDEIASKLYATLRLLDARKVKCAWVDCRLPPFDAYQAIADRLKRACQN